MPDAPDTTLDPVAEAPVSERQAAPAEPTDRIPSGRPFDFARAVIGDDAGAVLNAGQPVAAEAEISGTDGESASAEASKPAAAPTPEGAAQPDAPKPSRREKAEQANQDRIAELEAAVAAEQAARDQAVEAARVEERERLAREAEEAARAQEQADLGRKHLEDVGRLERLMRTPDAELSYEDINWREEQKELLAKYPQVERHFATVAEQRVAAAQAEVEQKEQAFWAGVREQLGKATDLPHVDPADLKADAPEPLRTWDRMAAYYHAAGAAWKDAEYAPQLAAKDDEIGRLKDEVRDLKLVGPRGLGSARAPITGGRSAAAESGPATFDPTRPARQNLAAALMGSSDDRRQ